MSTESHPPAGAPEPVAVDWTRVERLEWVQPRRLWRWWVLQADGEPVAVLSRLGLWKRGYTARTHAAEWDVREPLWGPTRLVRGDREEPEVEANMRWPWGYDLARAAGEPLAWRRRGWTSLSHTLETREKLPLVRVRERFGMVRVGSEIELLEAARGLGDLEALLLLTWVLQLRSHHARMR